MLIRAAEESDKKVEGMAGTERAFLYKVARMTGLRRSELASLIPASFRFGKESFVVVEAAYSKQREQNVLPLHPELNPLIRERLARLVTGDPLFPLLDQRKTADMVRHDIETARIPYRDGENRVADFHALRHCFITRAWESGATADVVMSLARHRCLQMTIRYTHSDRSAQ